MSSKKMAALDKIRFESLTDKIKLDGQPELFIHIISDKTNNTLSIIDNGIGMTKAGKVKYLRVNFHNLINLKTTILREFDWLSQDGRIRDANKVLNEMTESKIEAQNITGNTLINAYYKFGELKSALKFKNKLLEAGLKRDPFTNKALIHGFYKTNELERENELMFSMVDAGFTPSYCTFSWIGDGYNNKDNMDAVLALPDDQDVLDLMRIGQKNRVVGATGLNERSTRCHSVLTVHVRGRELVSNSIVKGCVDVVDLAELDQCKAGNYQNMDLLIVGERETMFSRTLVSLAKVLPQAKAVVMNFFEELDPPLFVQDMRSKLHSKSVAYVCFGTVVALPPHELVTVAEALEESGFPFLWSLMEGLMDLLPNGFLERTKMRGKVVSWAPQSKVLAHDSSGVFVSNCGANSVTESVCGEVPMICRPFFGDQGVAGRLIDVWEIGVVMEGKVFTENGLLKSLNLILAQEEGKKIRDNGEADCARCN
ncbi:hypothetical protein JHK86_016492 [Glycine max]|nr:hypothetical protein JHK86_016492 [Glycine max]